MVKKRIRNIILCFCLFCLVCTPITTHAAELAPETSTGTRMAYILSYNTDLTISNTGSANVTGYVRGKSGVNNAYVSVSLQKFVSVYDSWKTVKSWQDDSGSRNASVSESYSVGTGTYRLATYVRAGTESKMIYSENRKY